MVFRKKKIKDLSDLELIDRLRKNMQQDEFGVLYDRFSERVYHKCIALAKDQDLAKDLTHDIFIKVFLNLSKLEHAKAFSTWLYRITYSMCMDQLRADSKQPPQDDVNQIDIPEDEDELNEKVLMSMKFEQLTNVLEQISPEDKAVLLMKYQDDHSIKEIMEILELSESATKMKIKRAKERAARKFKELYNDLNEMP